MTTDPPVFECRRCGRKHPATERTGSGVWRFPETLATERNAKGEWEIVCSEGGGPCPTTSAAG